MPASPVLSCHQLLTSGRWVTVMFTFIGMVIAICDTLSYVKKFWRDLCKAYSLQLCNVLLARILHRDCDHGYVNNYWRGYCIAENLKIILKKENEDKKDR